MRCRCKKKLLVSQRWTLDQRDLAQKRVEHAGNAMLCHFAHHWGCAESFVCDVLPHKVADKLCWSGDGQGQATDVREQIDKLECPFFFCVQQALWNSQWIDQHFVGRVGGHRDCKNLTAILTQGHRVPNF